MGRKDISALFLKNKIGKNNYYNKYIIFKM